MIHINIKINNILIIIYCNNRHLKNIISKPIKKLLSYGF